MCLVVIDMIDTCTIRFYCDIIIIKQSYISMGNCQQCLKAEDSSRKGKNKGKMGLQAEQRPNIMNFP
jgi:hypothetical protein